jgi:hypothetical protein
MKTMDLRGGRLVGAVPEWWAAHQEFASIKRLKQLIVSRVEKEEFFEDL